MYEFFFNGSSWCYDFVSRVNINESFLNSFNFYWTSFTYLPTFFFWNLLLYTLYQNNINFWVVIQLFILYNFEVIDFLATNYNYTSLNYTYSSFNLLLLNCLNKYHPYIFYISVILTIWTVGQLKIEQFSPKHQFSTTLKVISYINGVHYVIFFNVLALFLGSWWALQEGTWGGWWNWDPSEVFGLLVTLFGLLSLHLVMTYTDLFKITTKVITKTLIILFFYFFIQLNFDLVSHNFGTKFFFFFSNNLFFIEALYILVALVISNLSYYWKVHTQVITWSVHYRAYVPNYPSLVTYAYLTLLYLLSLSFLPLLNYCLWNYFFINSFNIFGSYELVTSLLLVSLILFYKERGSSLHLLVIGMISPKIPTLYLMIIVIPIQLSTFVAQTHYYLLCFINLNLVSHNYSLVYWLYSLNGSKEVTDVIPTTRGSFIYVCDSYFIERHQLSYNSFSQPLLSSVMFYQNSSPNLHTFFLTFNGVNFINLYNLSSNYINTSMIIETNYLNNLYELFLNYSLFFLVRSLFFNSNKYYS